MERERIKRLLSYKRIAVIGFSNTPGKPSYSVPRYLMKEGYTIYPVNPTAPAMIDGLKVYRALQEILEEIDLVLIFRPSSEVMAIVEETLRREDVKGIWMQEGIDDSLARSLAEEKGISVIEDRCIYKEHRALMKT